MSEVNAVRIAEVMKQMADDLRTRAIEIERHAQTLVQSGDLDEAVAALTIAVSTQNLHAGRLLVRIINELQRTGNSEA
ncbi:hypothetical protein [Comamonas testosteroni]|uniref:hypothetical protein n=1 Tax=Comamonas testosteroni TaxID=285 RepID=UPI0005B45F53|nr:hypothetical protein [Comamonas testosteroni]